MESSREIYKDNQTCRKVFNKHYIVAFWCTLVVAIGLIIGGFLMPPKGVIDGSVMTSVGELFLWPALALGAKAIEEGRIAKFQIGHSTIHIGEDKDGNGLDDNWEKEQEEDV